MADRQALHIHGVVNAAIELARGIAHGEQTLDGLAIGIQALLVLVYGQAAQYR